MDRTLGRQIVKNIASNYLYVLVNMISAVFVTRMLLKGLGPDFYGFWSLLWNIFMYALLLDFGVGVTVQRYTAEMRVSGDVEKFNRIVSTVFVFYLLTMGVIFAAAAAVTPFLDSIFKLKPAGEAEYYKSAFLIFAIGNGLVFPVGIFSEVVIGLKRFDIKNLVSTISIAVRMAGIWLIFLFGGSLVELAIFVNGLNFFMQLALYLYVKRAVPGFRIRVKHFTFQTVREISEFSLFAYAVSIAELISYNTDRIVLGVAAGTGAIAVYQIATRLPYIMETLSSGFHNTLSSIAASLHYSGEKSRLNAVTFASFRFSTFVGTVIYLEFMFLTPHILYLWLDQTGPEIMLTAYLMLTSVYVNILIQANANRILQMGGRHRFTAIVTAVESACNLTISIILVVPYGPAGVALGTLIPNVFFTLFLYIPEMIRYSGIRLFPFIRRVFGSLWIPVIPAGLILLLAVRQIPLHEWSILLLTAVGAGSGLVYAGLGWFLYVRKEERVQIGEHFPQRVTRAVPWLFR